MLLRKAGVYAIRALLEMALDPLPWHSVPHLATAQRIPEAMLEQLLLQLRRAGLVSARRGRSGGYRLARPAAQLPLASILRAVGAEPAWAVGAESGGGEPATDQVTGALQRRLHSALERELSQLCLEDLLHDLRSARACLSEEGGLLLG